MPSRPIANDSLFGDGWANLPGLGSTIAAQLIFLDSTASRISDSTSCFVARSLLGWTSAEMFLVDTDDSKSAVPLKGTITSVQVIPEAGIHLLMGLGLNGLALHRRRRCGLRAGAAARGGRPSRWPSTVACPMRRSVSRDPTPARRATCRSPHGGPRVNLHGRVSRSRRITGNEAISRSTEVSMGMSYPTRPVFQLSLFIVIQTVSLVSAHQVVWATDSLLPAPNFSDPSRVPWKRRMWRNLPSCKANSPERRWRATPCPRIPRFRRM